MANWFEQVVALTLETSPTGDDITAITLSLSLKTMRTDDGRIAVKLSSTIRGAIVADLLISQPFAQWWFGQFENDQHNNACAKCDCQIVDMKRAEAEEAAGKRP